MSQVKVKHNNIESALRLFKRKIKDSGLLVELRERQYYTKPSVKRATKKKLGKVQIVGDDLFVSSSKKLLNGSIKINL